MRRSGPWLQACRTLLRESLSGKAFPILKDRGVPWPIWMLLGVSLSRTVLPANNSGLRSLHPYQVVGFPARISCLLFYETLVAKPEDQVVKLNEPVQQWPAWSNAYCQYCPRQFCTIWWRRVPVNRSFALNNNFPFEVRKRKPKDPVRLSGCAPPLEQQHMSVSEQRVEIDSSLPWKSLHYHPRQKADAKNLTTQNVEVFLGLTRAAS